jgi:PAS domain S-box-containing protein
MKDKIKILHLEDNPADAELVGRELQKQHINYETNVVDTKITFTEALNKCLPDIILSDHTLPSFNSTEALKIVQDMGLQIPFILVTATMSEEYAVQIIRQGADDYILKDRLNRLPSGVLNTLEKYRLAKEQKKIEKKILEKEKRANEALKRSTERYELIAKATSDMVWDWDLITGEIFRSKEGWEKIFTSFSYKNIGGEEDWQSRIHPDDKERVKNIKQEIFASTDNLFKIECRVLTDDGSYAYIQDRGYIIRDADNNPIRVIGAAKNITKRRLVEDQLKKLSLVAKETANAVIITDTDQKIQWVNEAFTRITEFEMADVIGKRPGSFLQGPDSSPIVVRYMKGKLRNLQAFECDIINYSKSGKKYWIRIQCQPEFDTNGKHIGYFALQTDISNEKKAEEKLKASEERYRNLFHNIPACIFLWDLDSLNILESNDNAAKVYGYTSEAFNKLNMLDLRKPHEYERIKAFAKKAKAEPEFKSELIWQHVTKTGKDIYMQIVSHKTLYKGKFVMMAMANDVTEKILLEENLEKEKQIKQKEITDAVITAQEKEREHIGSELHDNVNQILASALLYLGIAKRESTLNNSSINETDKLINDAIKEIRVLTHSMIAPSLEEATLTDALNNIAEIADKTGQFTIHKIIDCLDENAMPDKLKLSIYRIVQEQFTNIHKYAKAKNVFLTLSCSDEEIILTIKDDGEGFDTNKKSQGVGLLNIKTRASLYNGNVSIISSPGKGCELKIIFKKKSL